MPTLDEITEPYWWYRAKDQSGGNDAVVSAITDASGNARVPTSIAGTTVKTAGATAAGKSLRCTGVIQLPNPTAMLTAPPSGLTGKVATSQNYNPAYNGDQLVNGIVEWGWASGDAPSVGAPQWARFGPFAPGRTLTSYQLKIQGDTSRAPKDWKFQGAQDTAGPWTDLDTRAGYNTQDGAMHSFSFANTTAYAYYRILITATWGNGMVHLDEMLLDNVPNGGILGGEVWLVYRLITDGGASFRWGASGSANHWTFGGGVYSDFGETVRRSYGPTMALTTWRVVRLKTSFVGRHQEMVDNTQQLNVAGVAKAWSTAPLLWGGGGAAEIAEAFMTPELTGAQVGAVYDYLNTEHGLSVKGSFPMPTAGTLEEKLLSDAPLAWWRCRDTAGPLADSSGQGHPIPVSATGLTYDRPSLTAQSAGKAINFDGATSHASLNGVTWMDTPTMTFEARVDVQAATLIGQDFVASRWLAGGGGKSFLCYFDAGKWAVNTNIGGVDRPILAPSAVSVGVHTVGFTYDGVTVRSYVDGAEVASVAAAGAITASNAAFEIGRAAESLRGTFGISEVQFIPSALSAARMAARHAAYSAADAPPPPEGPTFTDAIRLFGVSYAAGDAAPVMSPVVERSLLRRGRLAPATALTVRRPIKVGATTYAAGATPPSGLTAKVMRRLLRSKLIK